MVKKKSLKAKEAEKLLCIFCYKLVRNNDSNASKESGEVDTVPGNSNVSVAKKMETCDKFFNQLHHPPPSVKKKKKVDQDSANASIVEEEDDDDDKNKKGDDDDAKATVENIAISWNHLKSGICIDCFYAVDTYARLFGKVEKMQRRLRWQLDRLYKVMKCAGNIPMRVQEFQDNLKGDKDRDCIKDFRHKVFQTCRQRLKSLNINVDGLGWLWKSKGQSEINLNFSTLNSSKTDLNSSSLATPTQTTKSTSVKRKSKGNLLERSPIKRASTQKRNTIVPTENDVATIFKCSKCCSTFPSLDSLTSHAKTEHWILKEEPGSHSDTEEEPVVVECTVEIKCGSKDEMQNLQKCIGKKAIGSPTSDSSGTFSISSADTEMRKNYPKLKKICKELLSHNPENDEEEESLKLAEKSPRPRRPKNSSPPKKKRKKINSKPTKKAKSSSNENDAICDKCGEIFTGTTLLQAETQLFRHLSANQLHYGEASWKYTCKICNKIFPKESTLTNHISKIHGKKKNANTIQNVKKKFTCSPCQKKFGKKENLVKHFQNAHKEKIQILEVRRKKKQMKVEKFEGGKIENESMLWEDCDDGGGNADMSVGDIGEHFEAVVVKHIEG